MGAGTSEAKIRLTAQDATGGAFATVLRNVGNLKTELTGLPAKFTQIAIASAGVGSIAGFASMIQESIEAKARLKDLSLESNISVEALSSLGKVGKYSNTSLEEIASASTKLSKALFTQNEDSKGAAAAIRALGLDFDKFKSLAPDQQIYAIAKSLDGFQDSSEKSAAAMLLFGKQGAQLLPFLKELSERGLEASRVTTEQAEQAKRYEDNLIALKSSSDEWKKALASDMLPALVAFSTALVDGRQAYGNWYGFIADTLTRSPFKSLAEDLRDVSKELDDLDGRWKKHQALPGVKLLEQIGLASDATDFQQRRDELSDRKAYILRRQQREALALGDELNAGYVDARSAVRKPRLKLPDAGTGDADALLKRIYQGRIKAAKDQLEQEKELADFRNKVLKGEYDDGLVSLAAFYTEQGRIRDDGVAAELRAIDKEIAAAKELAKSDKPETRQQAANAIADAESKRALIVQKGAHENTLALADEQRALKALAYSYADFLANAASLQGDELGAASLRRVKQVQDAQELLTKIGFGPQEAKARADAFGLLLEHTDSLRVAQSDYNRLVDGLGLREKEISLDAQASGASELDMLRAIGAERQKQLPILQALADKAVREAQAIGSPEALLAAQRLQLALKQAAAEADPIFTKIRDIGKEMGEALSNDAEEAVLHWEGARKLLLAIEQDLLRIATRKLFTEPLGNYLTNLIGGNGQASGGGGILGGILGKVFGFGGGSGGGAVNFGTSGDSFDAAAFGGFFADGGTLQPGQWGVAGENGPEPIYAGATPLTVIPNGGGRTPIINQHFHLSGPVDRRTMDQVSLQAAVGAQRALRRLG